MIAVHVRSFRDLTPDEQSAHREWLYGPRRGQGHAPVPDENKSGYCVARGPVGLLCSRRINWVSHQAFAPYGQPGTGHWRHSPRPYGRAGAA